MKKRVLALALSLVMMMSLLPTVAMASGLDNFQAKNTYVPNQFADVPDTLWCSDAVATAYELGIVPGKTATTFEPNSNLSVAEALALACRIHSIYNGGDGVFTQGDVWYQVYVDYAVENGIISAAPTQAPNAVTITRAELPSFSAMHCLLRPC